jgi:membrane-bound ClpP family serine protease
MPGEKMYADRIEKFKLLESTFDGKVLAYLTSDRNGFEAQIAQDAIDLIIDHLDNIGVVKRIILFLYTRGGLTSVAWNIVNLLRMFCDELFVVVPHKAHSAGTIICLGADKIIMTKQATLSPIDPSIITPLNPVLSNGNNATTPVPVSVEAVKGYIDLARKEYYLDTE